MNFMDDALSSARAFRLDINFPLPKAIRFEYGAAHNAVYGAHMADHTIPHFHNQAGLPQIYVGAREFMCVGALPPFDHPHIFIDVGHDNEAICPYCSTHYIYKASLHGHSEPAECELQDA